jgi:hypothetical protein
VGRISTCRSRRECICVLSWHSLPRAVPLICFTYLLPTALLTSSFSRPFFPSAKMRCPFVILSLGLFVSSVSASAFHNAPAAITPTVEILAPVPSPITTTPPSVDELRKRQNAQQTLLAAPDPTCGYFNASSGENYLVPISFPTPNVLNKTDQPWGCPLNNNCVFATATSAVAGATDTPSQTVGSVLCCDPTTGCPSTPAPTACVGNGTNEFSTSCTGSCLNDHATLKW